MIDSILNQLKRKFTTLQSLVLSNSITQQDALQQAAKLIFAANTILAGMSQEPDSVTQSKLDLVKQFKHEVEAFKTDYCEIYADVEAQPELVEELRQHLPETIHTDSAEEIINL